MIHYAGLGKLKLSFRDPALGLFYVRKSLARNHRAMTKKRTGTARSFPCMSSQTLRALVHQLLIFIFNIEHIPTSSD